MIFATIKGMTAVVKKMLAQGADMRSATPQGGTPLVLASEYGHNELVSLLLQEVHPFETSAVGRASKSSQFREFREKQSTTANFLQISGPRLRSKIRRPLANPPKTPTSAQQHPCYLRKRKRDLARSSAVSHFVQ